MRISDWSSDVCASDLLNLGKLALACNARAKRLFLKSIDYGIRAAHHFDYKWPVQYDVTDFSVITEAADADGRGQTDVGGVYAWVMLQAFELTDDKRFLDEARSEEHTSELQSLMRIPYAVFCLKK